MKGSNIKSKMGRLTYSACALFFASGLFVSCEDELLTGMPSWLGSSIYEELEKRGNYETMLRLINDTEVSSVNASTGETEYARTLRLTGSRTLFAANDEAFARFFASDNSWGAKSYEDLTAAQKRQLLNSSMLNSAYLVELLASESGSTDPTEGVVLRRASFLSLYDSVPMLQASDMPDTRLWQGFRERYPDGGQNRMTIFRDNTVSPMVHFLPDYMSTNSITDEDLSILTNGACSNTSESYINGQRLVEADVTCQNGYIQVLENVMQPLTNMAEAIRGDEELTMFSSLLDRFAVPEWNESLSSTQGVDSAYVWRYLNNGFRAEDGVSNNALLTRYNGDTYLKSEVLPYDPGWNQYVNGSGTGNTMSGDMAAIIAPTDAAFNDFFANTQSGQLLWGRYGSLENIPDRIIVKLMDNFMKYSLISTLPSRFETVLNTAGLDMGLRKEHVNSCLMANNGVVYKTNTVYNIPEYQAVSFPALLDDNLSIMRTIIEHLDYQAYLTTMTTDFLLILPTDEALKNYVDPVDYFKSQKTITEFEYDDSPTADATLPIKATRHIAIEGPNGELTKGDEIVNPWDHGSTERDYIENRLRDVLENSIILQTNGHPTDERVWTSKGNCPVYLTGGGQNIQIVTPYRKELSNQYGGSAEALELFPGEDGYHDMGEEGNGETFVVNNEPVMSASKSVLDVLEERMQTNDAYSEFYNMLNYSDLLAEQYNPVSSTSSGGSTTTNYRAISNGRTLSILENYNYTIYVPPTEEIEKMYANHVLPDWRDVQNLQAEIDRIEASDPDRAEILDQRRAEMQDSIDNFIRYHIQNTAVYLNSEAGTINIKYETSYMNSNNRFSTVDVDGGGNNLSITDGTGGVSHVVEGNYFAREYRFRSGTASEDGNASPSNYCLNIEYATRIFNSSMVVLHLLDKPLLYSEGLKYE